MKQYYGDDFIDQLCGDLRGLADSFDEEPEKQLTKEQLNDVRRACREFMKAQQLHNRGTGR